MPFMVEQVFLPMGEVWSMHKADTQSTVWGERRPKSREEVLCLNFSCLAVKYEFYFTTFNIRISCIHLRTPPASTHYPVPKPPPYF